MRRSILRPQLLEELTRRNVPRSKRFVQSSSRKHISAAPLPPTASTLSPTAASVPQIPSTIPSPEHSRSNSTSTPLSRIPTSSVLRTFLITTMSSSPILLSACFSTLRLMLDSKYRFLRVDGNPILGRILKSTFYAQFCAGETIQEVQANAALSRERLGYNGIILEYASEVLGGKEPTAEETAAEIETWRKGMLSTIELARPGDFVGMKWSGLGRQALKLLKAQQEPTPVMERVIIEVCDAAAAKDIAILPGAEEEITNAGLEKWTLRLQKKYNTPEAGKALLYLTYQCYLKCSPAKIARHLALAKEQGFIAGVKLVRGAYMTFEPRHTCWATAEETHKHYDGIMEALLKRQYNDIFKPVPGATDTSFPRLDVMLATHNLNSLRKASAIRSSQTSTPSEPLPRLTFAQLQGMADEISQELVQTNSIARTQPKDSKSVMDLPKVVKCMPWGTTVDCLNYLLRRAIENKDSAGRTADTRRAMGTELWKRMKLTLGLA